MIRTAEAVGGARSLSTVQWILVAVIAAIVVTVAKPIWFYANIRRLALQVVGRTRHVTWTTAVSFIRCYIILAVVHAITHL